MWCRTISNATLGIWRGREGCDDGLKEKFVEHHARSITGKTIKNTAVHGEKVWNNLIKKQMLYAVSSRF